MALLRIHKVGEGKPLKMFNKVFDAILEKIVKSYGYPFELPPARQRPERLAPSYDCGKHMWMLTKLWLM